MTGTSLVLFIPYGPPAPRRQLAPPAATAELIELVPMPVPPSRPDPARLAAARVYAATQSRRCAPVLRPTRGRIVDLAG